MNLYYDKEGNPIEDVLQWGRLFEDREYQIVKQESLWWGGWLSTVWLGIDHNWGGGLPLIFESMFFYWKRSDFDCQRYSTLEEAIQGHLSMKKYWNNPVNIFRFLIDKFIGSAEKKWVSLKKLILNRKD